jgi:hypothetical protein
MHAIFAAGIALVAGLAVAPAGTSERPGDGAMGDVLIGSTGDTGYTAGWHIAPDVNPRHRRLHHDRYEDGLSDGHRSAGR